MIIRDPCKGCIVQPMCRDICPDRDQLGMTYKKVINVLAITSIFFNIFLVSVIVLNYSRGVIVIMGVILFILSVGSIIFIFKLIKVKKTNERKFERRFSRVYGFER